MFDTIITLDASTDTADTPTDDDPTLPQKVRAWAFHCQGHHSPEISQRLGVPARTVRHWIATITRDLAAENDEQRATRLTLAIEESQRTRTLAATDDDTTASVAAAQTARRALSVAAHFLRLTANIDRDLAALESAFDEDCTARERQQLEDERDQREQEWEQQREEAREQQRADRERERFQREQARLDRAKERESEPRPPHTGDPAKIERLRELDHDDRAPIINAYFAACDTYHAARRAADHYARYLDGTLDGYLPTATEPERATNSATTQWHDVEVDTQPRTRATLPSLSLADIAALTARLDAEEAAADASND